MAGQQLNGRKRMRDARLAGEQRVAGKRASQSRTDDRQPFQADMPFGPWKQLADKDETTVGVLGPRSRLLDLHQHAPPEDPMPIRAPQLPHAWPPGRLPISAPDPTMS